MWQLFISWLKTTTVSDAISIVQTFGGLALFVVAYKEFKQWRVELIGTRRINLAIEIGTLAFKMQFKVEQLIDRTHSFYSDPGAINQEYFDTEFGDVYETMGKIFELQWEFESVSNTNIGDAVTRLRGCYSMLLSDLLQIVGGASFDETHVFNKQSETRNQFFEEFNSSIDSLVKITKDSL